MQQRTPEELKHLKDTWAHDPCWDIESTEGFEAHTAELRQFRLDHEQACHAAREVRLQALAAEHGITYDQAAEFERWGALATQARQRASALLVHYFQQALPGLGVDAIAEIEEIAGTITDAARAELMQAVITLPIN